MIDTMTELMEYLTDRGAPYGISSTELYEAIPEQLQSKPEIAHQYMKLKDISHIEPLSKGGNPNGDNWILEDSSVNRSRGAQDMSNSEQATAKKDSVLDTKRLVQTAAAATVFTTAGTVAEGALAAAEVAQVGGFIITALPTILTVGAIGGLGYLAYKAFKN